MGFFDWAFTITFAAPISSLENLRPAGSEEFGRLSKSRETGIKDRLNQ
jgi:hypothetical protein